tara:strand:+ start:1376 stop:2179 length:804 start_codon:yes stop_codon:yes gene_type:complete
MIKYINIFLTNFFGLRISKVKKPEILSMIKKWKPYDVGYELIRVGGDADGGYLAPDILSKSSYLFSPGCGNVFSFEEDMFKRNIKSFITDHTVNISPENSKKFNFIKKKLNTFNDETNITLKKWINDSLSEENQNNLILQMDIEGSEFQVILNADDEDLKKFNILIIEFHFYNFTAQEHFTNKIINNCFDKLLKNFDICHLHPNNGSYFLHIGNVKLPRNLEFTFINKKLVKYRKEIKSLPHPKDQKNVPNKPDLKLEKYFYKRDEK